jgi:hypothetical protein
MEATNPIGFPDDALAVRLRRLLNEGMLALLAGLGSRAGWFDALAAVQPARGDVVARAAGADEARLRAWLAALVAGRFVEYDGARETYALEPGIERFLRGEQGRAYERALCELVALAATMPRVPARSRDEGAGPSPAELLALSPGLAARVERGADVLVLGRGARAFGRRLAAALPAARPTLAVRGAVPRGARARFDAAFSVGDAAPRAPRLHDALAAGGVAILAVPALSDCPSEDALHPVAAFLLGARALAAPRAETSPLPARLAAAGLDVRALARVPSDPFRDYLVVTKTDSPRR